jgi:hypothetical protein
MKGIKIENYSNYWIFPELGMIWSIKSNRWIGYKNESSGYWRVTLTDDEGEKHHFQLSRVIWMSVNGDIPEGMEVNHKTENKDINMISCLELCTHKDNINYGTRNARAVANTDYQTIAEKLTNGVTSKKVGAYKNGELVMTFLSTMEAQRQGFSSGNISQCCKSERKTHKGYTWRYVA